jgi:formylglycine-generating enzyme
MLPCHVGRIALLIAFAGCRIGFVYEPEPDAAHLGDADISTPDGSERCPSGRGPAMSLVEQGFCVDNTEVTVAQYDEFLASAQPVDTSGRCTFNTSYEIVNYVRMATTNPAQAVAGIDWCDARDFCAWAGKRLCGRIGGGPLAYDEHASTQAQWYSACSRGGAQRFVYGDTAQVGLCHLDNFDNAAGNQAPVATYLDCVLAGTNVYDLLGNVQEWTDACETTAASPGEDLCRVVGGVWYFEASYADCDFSDPAGGAGIPRDMAEKHTGFRCCAD